MDSPLLSPLLAQDVDFDAFENINKKLHLDQTIILIEKYLIEGIPFEPEDMQLLGVASLLAFVQFNWTGPSQPNTLPDILNSFCLKELQRDGESVYPLAKYPWLLLFSLKVLKGSKYEWFYLRALYLHLIILDEKCSSLVEEIMLLLPRLMEKCTLGPEAFCEAALFCITCGNQTMASEYLNEASKGADFVHELTGVLGRRTKFQEFDVSQLVLKYDSANTNANSSSVSPDKVKNIALNDDLLMENPSLSVEKPSTRLTASQKCILLAECKSILTFYAREDSIIEKGSSLIRSVIAEPCEWAIYSSGLFLRSILESKHRRMLERAALQFQALVDQMSDLPQTTFYERAAYFFNTPFPSEWELDRNQATLFANLGAVKTASEIFHRRQMWDEYVTCLIQLGEKTEVIKVIEGILFEKGDDNGKMMCILGDLLEDHTLYEKAWTKSNGKCARAMRSLGMYYIKENNLLEAIRCFEAALSLNSLFDKIWFLLGCAALQVDDYQKALNAFSRTVSIDEDHTEGWNSLAAVHLHLGNEEEGFKCLKEAGKRKYDNVRIWENIFKVALSLGEIMEGISAYRRLCEIRGKEENLEGFNKILQVLQQVLSTHDKSDKYVSAVIRQINSLLDSVMASNLSMRIDFWYACARYAEIIQEPIETVEFYFKAYRSIQGVPLEHDIDAFRKVLDSLQKIKTSIDVAESSGIDKAIIDLDERRSQLKMMVKNLHERVKDNPLKAELDSFQL